jgi:hypothetical protein
LAQWGTEHAFKPGDTISSFVDKKRKRQLKSIELKSSDGRVLQGG